MNIRRYTQYLHSADVVIIAFGLFLTVLNVVFASRIPNWWLMILINFGVSGLILWLGYARHKCEWKVMQFVHDWYVGPLVFLTFKELYFMIRPIHDGVDYDSVLISVDRWLFGVDPTHWLMQFATPWLTEILQIAYTLFYFLFLLLGYELYRQRKAEMFHYFMFTAVYGFFLSYIGYFFLPAVGPRFTIHDFASLNLELPGIWLTEHMRWFVNAGESIPPGITSDAARMIAQRDVFPSGHTMMTLVMMYLSARYNVRPRVRWLIFVVGTFLIVATVYQRYHYVIDLIAGAAFMIFCVATSRRLQMFIMAHFGTLESRISDREILLHHVKPNGKGTRKLVPEMAHGVQKASKHPPLPTPLPQNKGGER